MNSWDKISVLLGAQKVSKKELASICDVSPSAITKWASGGGIDAENIAKIAVHFGVTSDWILGLSNNPKASDSLKLTNKSKANHGSFLPSSKNLKISKFQELLEGFRKSNEETRRANEALMGALETLLEELKEE